MKISSIKKDILKIFIVITYVVSVVSWCRFSQAQGVEPLRAEGGGAGAKILTIGVVHGATQSNMRQLPVTKGKGHQNWGCVKAPNSNVHVMVTLSKNDAATINAVDWHGQGAPLPGQDNRYRMFGKDESKRYAVKPTLGGVGLREIYIWVIWATYQIRIDGNLDQFQKIQNPMQMPGSTDIIDSPILKDNNQVKWINALGGGSSLGAVDVCSHPLMNYAYAVGRTQGVAYLTPAGVEKRVYPSSWKMRRNMAIKSYENGFISVNKVQGDNSLQVALDTDPTDNSPSGPQNTIYDADAPGCSSTFVGTVIVHTSETYDNFDSWAAVVLDTEYRCSEYEEWAYKARLNGDLDGCKTTENQLYSSHIDISDPGFYAPYDPKYPKGRQKTR